MFGVTVGCTQNREIKNKAVEALTAQFESELKENIRLSIGSDNYLATNYLVYIQNHTQYSIDTLERESDDLASVRIKMVTVHPHLRQSLEKIILKLTPQQKLKFNVGEAMELIMKHEKEIEAEWTQYRVVYLLRKKNEWIAIKK